MASSSICPTFSFAERNGGEREEEARGQLIKEPSLTSAPPLQTHLLLLFPILLLPPSVTRSARSSWSDALGAPCPAAACRWRGKRGWDQKIGGWCQEREGGATNQLNFQLLSFFSHLNNQFEQYFSILTSRVPPSGQLKNCLKSKQTLYFMSNLTLNKFFIAGILTPNRNRNRTLNGLLV